MSQTGDTMNQYSDEILGDSYYGYTDGLHTIQVIYDDFVGRIRLQATLDLEPTVDSWFDIIPDVTTGDEWNPSGYLQWNQNAPAKLSEAYTFRGNYTYIRVYMDREHIADGETYSVDYGQIQQIILSA